MKKRSRSRLTRREAQLVRYAAQAAIEAYKRETWLTISALDRTMSRCTIQQLRWLNTLQGLGDDKNLVVGCSIPMKNSAFKELEAHLKDYHPRASPCRMGTVPARGQAR